MFKAIFWDNDGILVDTEPLFFKATSCILKDFGVTLTEDMYTHNQLKRNTSAFDLVKDKGINEEIILKARKERDSLYEKFLKSEVLIINGVKETLEKLNKKFLMGIVTSSLKVHFDIIMKSAGIKNYFDFFIMAEDTEKHKPHPDQYLLALRRTKLSPAECLVIEDTERGVVAAKKAGLTCYAIPTELSRANDFSLADKVLNSIIELPDILFN